MDALARDIREDILPDYLSKLTRIVNNLNTRNAIDTDPSECSISLEPIEVGSIVVELECGHIFHKHSIITNIFNLNNKCPLCRKRFFNIPRIDTSSINYIGNDNVNNALTAILAMSDEEDIENPLSNAHFQSLF